MKDLPPPHIACMGMTFPMDPKVLSRRTRQALERQEYEKKEATAALKLIREGDVVLELGGGIGFMSTLVATRTKAAAVHSYEANPGLIDYIRRVHMANGASRAQITHAVLGATEGETTFYVRRNFLASSLAPLEGDTPETVTPTPVPVRNGSAEIARLKPSVLICDIEGAELDLLPQLDLTGLRAVLIELHPQWIGRDGIRKVFAALDRHDLVFFPRWSDGKVAVFRRDW